MFASVPVCVSMSMSVCGCAYVCVCVLCQRAFANTSPCVCAFACSFACACMCVCLPVRMCMHVCICVDVDEEYVKVKVYMYSYMYVCACACTCACACCVITRKFKTQSRTCAHVSLSSVCVVQYVKFIRMCVLSHCKKKNPGLAHKSVGRGYRRHLIVAKDEVVRVCTCAYECIHLVHHLVCQPLSCLPYPRPSQGLKPLTLESHVCKQYRR